MLSMQRQPGVVEVWNDPHERGHESGGAAPTVLFTVKLEGEPVASPAPIPTVGPPIERLVAKGPEIPIVLDEGSQNGEMVFTVNGKAHPDVPPIGIKLGESASPARHQRERHGPPVSPARVLLPSRRSPRNAGAADEVLRPKTRSSCR